jgi:hypothetical protein
MAGLGEGAPGCGFAALTLDRHREPIQLQLWVILARVAHHLQDHEALHGGAFVVMPPLHPAVLSQRGPDLIADFGKRHLIATRAESLPQQVDHIGGPLGPREP